jgi:aryl-alcohol dehydrogenase-like predicted oxidoreductase
MANKLDPATARAARQDARRLEKQAARTEPYPESTTVSRANQPSRMFNVRLTEEQFAAIQDLAAERHLPMSTMARAWLLDRLDREKRAS